MKQVRETAAGKAISAYIILNPEGKHVATIQVHNSGSASRVDVWDGHDLKQGRATGWGYDREKAAMAGLSIDGHKLYDNAGRDETSEAILARYHAGKLTDVQTRDALRVIGAGLSNYSHANQRWESAHYAPGLDRLTALGYKVIQAI